MAESRRPGQDHIDASEADEMDNRPDDTKYRSYNAAQGSRADPVRSVMPTMTKGPKTERSIDRAERMQDVEVQMTRSLSSHLTDHDDEIEVFPGQKAVSKSLSIRPQLERFPLQRLEVPPVKSPAPVEHSLFRSPFGPYFSEGKNGVQKLPALFHLECTNLVIKSSRRSLPFEDLKIALEKILKQTRVDMIDYVSEHAVFECSYHQGNRFMSLFVRVFEPPPRSTGQLLDKEDTIATKIDGSFLVEVQLREGDRLYFSTLFRELQGNFKKYEGLIVTGTLRYEPKSRPDRGEGLRLESLPDHQQSSFGMGGLYERINEVEDSDSFESMDEDMIKDIVKLAEALQSKYLDVQADAATAVAGLTSDVEFCKQLADPKAEEAADALCSAAARLLAETDYRPARRQAAVAVANLSTVPALCTVLLDSDPPLTTYKRGLVDALVTLSMLGSREGKEEEIGTRRECMRALIELAKMHRTRYLPAMVELRRSGPSGKGRDDETLMNRLKDCRTILSRRATVI